MLRSLIFLFIFNFALNLQSQTDENLQNEIRIKVEQLRGNGLIVQGEKICCGQSISTFYTNRLFETIWTNELIEQLLSEIALSKMDGLDPEDYHIELLRELAQVQTMSPYEQANFELLLTDSFLLLATHLLSGKVNPVTINPDWRVVKREGDPVELLAKAIIEADVQGVIDSLRPKYKAYGRLKEKLRVYREVSINGGWGTVEDGPTIKPGEAGDRVLQVRNRLTASGDLQSYTNDEPELYDEVLKEAVRKFQIRHGLEVDGSVGKSTLAAMNVSVEDRIQDIILNLERCRWLPQDLGDHYVMVNLPAYEMEVIKGQEVTLEMGVAVGKPYRQTPVFSSKLSYMVINPYWTVPPTILYQDMIPAQIKNANYLPSLQIKVLDQSGNEVDPATINWSGYNRNFPYTLRQEPGKLNALGRVKFIFPNEFNIYMHDTNHPEVFAKYNRALSSGCIRLAQPMELAYYLGSLQSKPLNREAIDELSKSKSNQAVILSEPLTVHMQYWTAFVDERGSLNFRPDIYDRNPRLLKAFTSSL